MAVASGVNSEHEMFKIVYGKDIVEHDAEVAVLQEMYPIDPDATLGKEFNLPVAVAAEGGVTYLADDQPANLNPAVAGVEKMAKVTASQIYINGAVTRNAVLASLKSQAAFRRATSWKVMNMIATGRERIEFDLLYGQDVRGIGVAATFGGAASGGRRTVTFNQDSWAPGLWGGKNGTPVDVYDTTGATKRNTTGDLTIVSADVNTRTVVFAGATADLDAVVATDVFWFKGSKGNQCLGLYPMSRTITGTLLGIDTTTYDLFRGNQHAVGGALNYAAVQSGLAKAVNRGLRGDATLFVSTEVWPDLAAEVKDLQVFNDGSQAKEAELGTQSLVIHYQRGKLKVVGHPLVRIGDAIAFQDDVLMRVGVTDLTFSMQPGDTKERSEVFFAVPNTNYFGLIAFASQALFCMRPSRTVGFGGITT